MIYDFLDKPRNILKRLRYEQNRLEGLRQSLYPSAIRYDTDKVISSPSDPMPEYAGKVEELQQTIAKLQREYWQAMDDIADVAVHLGRAEQDVIMCRYVAQKKWRDIAVELRCSERWVFIIHRRAVRHLEKMYPKL